MRIKKFFWGLFFSFSLHFFVHKKPEKGNEMNLLKNFNENKKGFIVDPSLII
jgi:hypothetical protein